MNNLAIAERPTTFQKRAPIVLQLEREDKRGFSGFSPPL
jgi:hypothetical protein